METFSVKRIKNIESKNFPFHVQSTTTFTKMFAFITTLKVSKTIKFLFSRQDASKGNVFLFVCFIEKLKICIYFLSFLLDIKLDCLYHQLIELFFPSLKEGEKFVAKFSFVIPMSFYHFKQLNCNGQAATHDLLVNALTFNLTMLSNSLIGCLKEFIPKLFLPFQLFYAESFWIRANILHCNAERAK